MMTRAMLDIETWGLHPGCALRSIGACIFGPNGIGATFYIAIERDGQDGLHVDPATVAWWQNQSAEAQTAFDNAVPLSLALKEFATWYELQKPDTIWAHGPAFDHPNLGAAYRAIGDREPWHYRAVRDTRTAFDQAGIVDHSAWLDRFNTGTHHNALDDAITQAKAVVAALWPDKPTMRYDTDTGTAYIQGVAITDEHVDRLVKLRDDAKREAAHRGHGVKM